MSNSENNVVAEIENVTVIGAGVIGISFAALYLAHGFQVVVHDVADDIEGRVKASIEEIKPSLAAMGLNVEGMESRLSFEADLETAVSRADVIQENGPERIGFKRKLWPQIERFAPAQALLFSSSSGIPIRMQSKGMREPERLMLGHPVNPPHIMPLIEMMANQAAQPALVERAMGFYRSVGKKPILLRKELPGFAVNRLQTAFLREAILLVRWGVVTVDEVDDIVTHSLGLRWATGGPFLSFHMGGGPTGFAGFLKHFATGVQLLWLHSKFTINLLTPSMRRKLLTQIESAYGGSTIKELEALRNGRQIAVLQALEKEAAGK
ncbi:MAG: 3-hydroxyacyl-CoA dehydrogenase NAD-binding domain-containing protein [Salinisphaeraceae bacterium]|nr:3-hydroxyacyl-CoA dehydrogenase NAD-binding domain-containing protein [Salinisphaeraceae bacterium]